MLSSHIHAGKHPVVDTHAMRSVDSDVGVAAVVDGTEVYHNEAVAAAAHRTETADHNRQD